MSDVSKTTERELEAVKEHREKWMARAFRAETERDAAVAAIERVRAIHKPSGIVTPVEPGVDPLPLCRADLRVYPCPTVAALDGAPEPEVKP